VNGLRDLLIRLAALDVTLTSDGTTLDVDAPDGALTDQLLADLRARKPALIAHLVKAEAGRRLATDSVPPVAESASYPLSFAQRRLWFLDRLEGTSSAYNLSAAFRIVGPLDRSALAAGLDDLIARHPMLRVRFVAERGEPRQIVAASIPTPLTFDEADDESAAYRIVRAAADLPFDLAVGPPIRVTLLRIGDDEHLLAVALAHIVADGWTIGVIAREWSACYNGRRANAPIDLPPPAAGYVAYADWQRRMVECDGYAEPLDRWSARLAGAPTTLEIPTDRRRPPRQTFAGAVAPLGVGSDDTARIKSLAVASGATIFMAALAAYAVLLARYTGVRDLLVGVPIANRNRSETEGVVGLFANIVPVRVIVEEGITFRRLLDRVRAETLAAYADQEVPFDLLVERLAPERDLSRNPLIQTMFAFQNSPANGAAPELAFDRTVVTPIPLPDGSVRFDLETHVWEEGDRLRGELLYNTALYDAETARRLAGDYVGWMARLAAAADRPVDEVTTLAPEARRTVVETWNETAVDYPRERTLPQLIERQAAATPDAVAVACGDIRLTYAELDAHATRLAGALAAVGAKPGALVGLLAGRSEKTVGALLAIMKTGAGYLPLDPAYPADRIAYMLRDAGAVAVVTDEASRALAGDTPTVSVDAVGEADLTPPRADDTAYVIYTSGSTGKPKGVEILHRNIVNFLLSMADKPGIGAADTLLAVTTVSFDISTLELFLPLTVGATVVVARREEATDGAALARLVATSGATVMQATPATWRLLLAAGWRGGDGFTILCGGEALTRDLADDLTGGGATVWNMYGPTETTVWSTIRAVGSGGREIEPVGRPIANTRLYILDPRFEPTPIGVTGELYIGGAGVSPGYLNRPDLTAERFLPDPFVPGRRIYKTGDLARYAADGTVEYRGRIDTQVKLRGYRIELGELEAVIAADAQVSACVCAVKRTAAGETLVAYVQAKNGAVDEAALRRRVRAWAPDYMNPARYVVVGDLPLTPNGKVDRNRLPAPTVDVDRAGYRPPGAGTEKIVAAAWADALGLERLCVDENVFDVGAHSFLAMKVHHRLCDELDRPLEVVDLFRYPTVASLARRIDEVDPGEERAVAAVAAADKRKASFARQRDRTLKARGVERKQ
jgi:amino acid adenylation domain-containing protein